MTYSEKAEKADAFPKVRPIKPAVPDAPMPQPKYPTLPRIPTRALLVAPSGSSKTTTLIWWLMVGTLGLWDRIYIFCKTGACDSAWAPLIRHIRRDMKVPEHEQVMWSDWDAEAVEDIIETAALMTSYQRKKGRAPFSIAVIVDDHAEDSKVVRGKQLQSLYLKGRHYGISTFVTSQSYKLLDPGIRKNALSLLAWRTRTSGASSDSQAIAEAVGGTLPGGAKEAEALLKDITSEQYQFAYIDATAQPGKVWHRGWEPAGV